MAGRRRKNTVAGSKKESPKTQNTLQETNVSTDKEATKADVKKQAEDVNEKKTADAKIAVPSVLSVMRNVSVPFGINTPEKPYISSTRWRSVSDQKNKVYYFESTLTPNMFWLDLKKIDFSPKAGIKKLSLTKGEIYAGDAVKDLKDSQSFTFLFQTPVM